MASIFDRLRAKAQQAITGVGNFIDQNKATPGVQLTQNGLGNDVQKFFAPVPDQVRPRDIARELPGAAYQVGTEYFTQPVARGIQTLVNTVGRGIGATNGVTTPEQIAEQVPNPILRDILYGNKPITSLQDVTERRSPQLADILQRGGVSPETANAVSPSLTFLGAGLLTAADALPGDPTDLIKGGGKAVLKEGGEQLVERGAKNFLEQGAEDALAQAPKAIDEILSGVNAIKLPGRPDFLATERGLVETGRAVRSTQGIDQVNNLLKDVKTSAETVVPEGLRLSAPAEVPLLEDILARPDMPNFADNFASEVLPTKAENAVKAAEEAIRTTKSGAKKALEGLAQPSLTVIEKAGDAGKQAATLIRQSEETGARLAGDWLDGMRKALKNLNPQETATLADVIEGKATPISQAQQNAVNTWRYIANDLRKRGLDAGLDIGKVESYFPHIPDESQFTPAIKEVVQKAMSRTGQRRYGNLELPRELNVPYLKDPSVLMGYIEKAARRVTDAQNFGPADEKLYELAKQAGTQGGDTNQLIRYMDQILGKNGNPTAEAVSKTLRNVQSFKLNPTTSLRNLTQNISTLVRTDVDSVGRAIGKIMTNPEEARSIFVRSGESGVEFEKALQDLSGATGKYIKGIGMGISEKANRVVAVNSGYEYASKLAKQFEGGSQAAMRELERLGFTAEQLAEGLNKSDFITAGRRISQETQFSTKPGELPFLWNTAAGKVATQFKPFAYKQTKFLKDLVGRVAVEAGHGNLKPLMAVIVGYGLAAPVAGEIINDVKSIVTNKKRDNTDTLKDRYISNLFAGFSLGLVDSLPALGGQYGPKGVASTLGGPTVSTAADATEVVGSLPAILNGDEYAGRTASRDILKQIPVVGQTLSNTLVPNSYVENYIGPNTGMSEKDAKTYQLLQSSDPAKAEAFKQSHMSVNKEDAPTTGSGTGTAVPQEGGGVVKSLKDMLGMSKPVTLQIPGDNATYDEKKKFREDAQLVINQGGNLKPEEWKRYILGDSNPDDPKIDTRTKAYDNLKTAMNADYYTDEQKQAILDASGVDKDNFDYYALASKDPDARLQELLPKLDNMSNEKMLEFLMMGRRAVAGKQLVSTEMVDYLYENDRIGENERDAIKALRFDEINNKFYFTKAFAKKGEGKAKDKITYKEALAMFKVALPKFSTLGGIQNLLKTYTTQSSNNESKALLQNILQQSPQSTKRNGNLWF